MDNSLFGSDFHNNLSEFDALACHKLIYRNNEARMLELAEISLSSPDVDTEVAEDSYQSMISTIKEEYITYTLSSNLEEISCEARIVPYEHANPELSDSYRESWIENTSEMSDRSRISGYTQGKSKIQQSGKTNIIKWKMLKND